MPTTYTQTGSGGAVAAGTATNSRIVGGFSQLRETTKLLQPTAVFQANLYPYSAAASLIPAADQTLQKVLHVVGYGAVHNGDTFTVRGQTAISIRDAYTTKVVNDYTSFPLMLVSYDI
jgi:hypothetical protein